MADVEVVVGYNLIYQLVYLLFIAHRAAHIEYRVTDLASGRNGLYTLFLICIDGVSLSQSILEVS